MPNIHLGVYLMSGAEASKAVTAALEVRLVRSCIGDHES